MKGSSAQPRSPAAWPRPPRRGRKNPLWPEKGLVHPDDSDDQATRPDCGHLGIWVPAPGGHLRTRTQGAQDEQGPAEENVREKRGGPCAPRAGTAEASTARTHPGQEEVPALGNPTEERRNSTKELKTKLRKCPRRSKVGKSERSGNAQGHPTSEFQGVQSAWGRAGSLQRLHSRQPGPARTLLGVPWDMEVMRRGTDRARSIQGRSQDPSGTGALAQQQP